jgi:putative alpha-1,2-mannosidase
MQYKPKPDGLGDSDDCGQMSAWYIFSSLAFYPASPGGLEYALGAPAVKNASLSLENGKTFRIEAINQSDKNIYVHKFLFKELNKPFITPSDITSGGKFGKAEEINFNLGKQMV